MRALEQGHDEPRGDVIYAVMPAQYTEFCLERESGMSFMWCLVSVRSVPHPHVCDKVL